MGISWKSKGTYTRRPQMAAQTPAVALQGLTSIFDTFGTLWLYSSPRCFPPVGAQGGGGLGPCNGKLLFRRKSLMELMGIYNKLFEIRTEKCVSVFKLGVKNIDLHQPSRKLVPQRSFSSKWLLFIIIIIIIIILIRVPENPNSIMIAK